MNKINLPRGLRNHNPLNIRISKDEWQGLAPVQSDPSFFQFVSNAYGYRAAFRIIQTYQSRYHACTIDDIIKRWAPPSENNVRAYVARVSKLSGISSLVNVYWSNKEDMCKIVAAMHSVENGADHPAIMSEIEDGYRLAFNF